MIIYHPRNDLYHCMFRFMMIAKLQNLEKFEPIRLRIYDLFYLFPHFVSEIDFPRGKGIKSLKNKAEKLMPPYEALPNKKRLFSEMGDYHIQALQILKAKNLFQEHNGLLNLGESYFMAKVQSLIEENLNQVPSILTDSLEVLNSIEILGGKGLKKRTGLMEYRYDAV
jgi:hypothetical protein